MFNNHLLRYATGAAAPVQIQRSFRMNNFGFGLPLYARFASAALTCGIVLLLAAGAVATAATPQVQATEPVQVTYGTVKVDGLNIAYREAGNLSSPKLVLLHGFPASSHQYRDLIRVLGDRFHVIAPDYPGFGDSDTPDPATYGYTFDKISDVVESFLTIKGFDHYGLFVQDYGGPVGFRILARIRKPSTGSSFRTPMPTKSGSPPLGTDSAVHFGRTGHPRQKNRWRAS